MGAQAILIVADDGAAARELSALLQRLGYRVQSIASSGLEALGRIAQERPDLVLLDVALKGDMDGVETAHTIRQRWPIPIVFLAPCADEATLLRAKVTKPYGYFIKPYSEPELRAGLEVALYRHQADSGLLAAMEKDSPDERLASLQAVCAADPALRRWFDRLLATLMEAGTIYCEPEQPTVPAPAEAGGEGVAALGETSADKPGACIRLDNYQVLGVLGKGGMGIVFKAYDAALQRIVAIKAMTPQLAASTDARKRFLLEARAMAAIRDDHVIDVYQVQEQRRIPFLVMEYVVGISLEQKLRNGLPLGLEEILPIAYQAACGLEAAHTQGLIHRDIKPSNILLEGSPQRVKLTDFGLACAVGDARLPPTGPVCGTPGFMAPEQAKGDSLDCRSDLFSLGSVVYAMCTGQSPFQGVTPASVVRQVCRDAPAPIGQLNPAVPAWLVEIVTKLHAKRPEHRFQTAAELGAALRPHLLNCHRA